MGVGVVYGCKLNGLAEIPTIYSYFSTYNFLLNQDFGSGQLGNTTNSFRNHMASLIMVKPRPDPSKVHINKMDVIPTSLSPPLSPHSPPQIETTILNNCCPFCKKNKAPYTCPRCLKPYCSAACYKIHGLSCSEEFFKGRVMEERQFDRVGEEEGGKKIGQVLMREKEARDNEEGEGGEYEGERAEIKIDEMEIDALVNLHGILESTINSSSSSNTQNDFNFDSINELLKTLPDSLQRKFKRDLRDEKELEKCVVPWRPFWLPEIHAIDSDEIHANSIDETHSNNAPSLEELSVWIIDFPKFTTLSPTATSSSPNLLFNLVSILASLVSSMQLHNGDFASDPLEVCGTIIAKSAVLSTTNPRNFSSMAEVWHNNENAGIKADVDLLLMPKNLRNLKICFFLGVEIAFRPAAERHSKIRRVLKKLEFYTAYLLEGGGGGRFARDLQSQGFSDGKR